MTDQLQHDDDFQPRLSLALWRKILLFARPYRWHLLALVILAIITAGCDLALPLLTGRIIDRIRIHGADAGLLRFGLLYIGVIGVLGICVMGFIVLAGRVTTGVSYDIRKASFDRLQDLGFSFYDRKAVGWLMARLTSDCGQLSRVMGWALLDIAWGLTLLGAVAATMFILNWRLALIVLLIVPPLLWASRYFQVRILITSRRLRKANSHTTAGFNEGIISVRTTRSFAREQQNLAEFDELTGAMYGHAVRNALYQAMFLPLVLSICSLGIGLALWRGGVEVIAGTISLGVLVTFIQYAAHISNPVQELATALTTIQGAQASAERIQGLLDEPLEIADSPQVLDRIRLAGLGIGGDEALAEDGLPRAIQRIEFRDVSFAYRDGQPVLKDFNLIIEAGQSVALVGPTGGGKTTIVGLLCRFYEPTAGQILINGLDYRQRPLHWLQSSLGIVLQQPHLFSGTIRENIRYGRLEASDQELERAARLVNAHEFIMAAKDGYDAQVGEGGGQLSTGQKQLIALARAIIANPQVFIMDEATSSIDTHTERAIQGAIDRILRNRISVVIAHRLSTIRSADRILVISGGRIIEDGDHASLLRLRGQYHELYMHQFTEERESVVLDGLES
jgi:ATP-binding cassette, subfamily B, bacterial